MLTDECIDKILSLLYEVNLDHKVLSVILVFLEGLMKAGRSIKFETFKVLEFLYSTTESKEILKLVESILSIAPDKKNNEQLIKSWQSARNAINTNFEVLNSKLINGTLLEQKNILLEKIQKA